MKRHHTYTALGYIFVVLGFAGVLTSLGTPPPQPVDDSPYEAGVVVGYAIAPLVLFCIAGLFIWLGRRTKRREEQAD